MKKILIFGLLIFVLLVMFSLPSVGANWWNKFGEPKYGGTMIMRVNNLALDLDPAATWGGLYAVYGDFLWNGDWTLDRNIWSFQSGFAPDDCWKGCLAETWEMTDPQTLTVHLRRGVHWQNKPPVNGREFVADDVQQHYDRILGTGSGYSKPNMFHAPRFDFLDKVIATDKYTVVFKLKKPTTLAFIGLAEQAGQNWVEPPEVAKMKDGFKDWKYAIGTGPWLLTDFVSGSSVTYTKNPKYWGSDERYPPNQLPYADEIKTLLIPDIATTEAAMRTDKIFMISDLTWTQARNLSKTNAKLLKISAPTPGQGIIMTVDKKPFDDIRVRKAMQMAIDLQTIARNLFGGTVEGNPCGIVSPLFKGYDYPYEEWPQALKDEYSYNQKRAKQLLKEAGFPNGFQTNCPIGSALDMELAQVFKAYLMDINIDMELKPMDMPAFMNFSRAKKQDQLLWTGAACARVFPPKLCIGGFSSKDMANYGNVRDTKYDAICSKFLGATNPEKAKQLVRDAVKYALEKHWILTTFARPSFTFWQPYLKGYSGEMVQNGSYVNARLWIDKD